jgi:hypothetical protein
MERHEMIARLKALRLHGMVAAFDEVIDEGIKRTRLRNLTACAAMAMPR